MTDPADRERGTSRDREGDTSRDRDSPRDRGGARDCAATRAREYVLDSHAEIVETVLECADAVADDWDDTCTSADDGRATTDPSEVADPLRAELEASGAWAHLPDVLAGAVRAAGYSLSASPVADPPYVAATSRGPMLRATVSDGRLVVLLEVFEIRRADGDRTLYVRGGEMPEDVVRVTFEQVGDL